MWKWCGGRTFTETCYQEPIWGQASWSLDQPLGLRSVVNNWHWVSAQGAKVADIIILKLTHRPHCCHWVSHSAQCGNYIITGGTLYTLLTERYTVLTTDQLINYVQRTKRFDMILILTEVYWQSSPFTLNYICYIYLYTLGNNEQIDLLYQMKVK